MPDTTAINELFEQYLKVCNRAIDQHKDDFFYGNMVKMSEALMGDNPIDLAVYDDRPQASYSLVFKDHQLKPSDMPPDAKRAWKVNRSYLEKVVANPEEYIENPERLDLDWLSNRMGL